MAKEKTPLEALKEINYLIIFDEDCEDEYGDPKPIKVFLDEVCPNELKIIEEALKESAKNKLFINEILDMLSNDNNINDVLNDIKNSDSYEDFATIYSSCPKEKYDLIREVLL